MSDESYLRRSFIKSGGKGVLGAALLRTTTAAERISAMSKTKELILYIGTYTTDGSKGIYIGRLNTTTGKLTVLDSVEEASNPSYLTIDRRQRYLYAVNEIREFRGKEGGAITAFSIDPKTHALQRLNQQPSHGASPCYVSLDRTGGHLLVANYVGGNVSVFPVLKDGSLGVASDIRQHHRGSADQKGEPPHAHAILLDPTNKYAVASDLGLDKLMIYGFDQRTGKFGDHQPPFLQIGPGSGPRHLVFHPNDRYVYVINERGSTVTALTFTPQGGTFKEIQTITTLPGDFTGVNYCADIHLSASGKFLYGSNRGHDSIAVFEVKVETGELVSVQHQATQGKTPRNFALDPTGKFLLAANQESDSIVTLSIDQQTGQLRATGCVAEVPTPVCLKFLSS